MIRWESLPDNSPFGYGIFLIRLVIEPILVKDVGGPTLVPGDDFPLRIGDLNSAIVVQLDTSV